MKNYLLLFPILIIIISLGGCGRTASEGTVSLTPEITMTSPPQATKPFVPTATPSLPSVFVVIPDETNPSIVDQTLPVIQALASQSGMELKTVSMITPQDLENQDARLLVIFSPSSNLTEIAQALPTTQILGISFPDIKPSENVSLIQIDEAPFDIKSFLAGYIAAAVTTDWRTGLGV